MFRLPLFALLVPAFAVAAPVPKGQKKEPYFPVTVGTKRLVEGTVGKLTLEFTEIVTGVVDKDGVYMVTVEGAGGRRGETVYEVSHNGVSQLAEMGATSFPLLKLGGKAGDNWVAGPRATGISDTFTLGQEEEVEVPAGTFKAVRVDCKTGASPNDPGYTITEWYAPGVGLVKQKWDMTGFRPTLQLKEFIPGKEKTDDKKVEPKKDK